MTEDKSVEILVPQDEEMAEEPALTIGEIFANKTMVQPAIGALVAVIAGITGWVADDEVISNLTYLVTFGSIIWTAISADRTAKKRALDQAKATREVVYAPATVARAVADERAGLGQGTIESVVMPDVAPPPPDV